MQNWEEKNGLFLVKKKVIPASTIVHVIQRAPGKEPLFLEESDRLYFLKILKETSIKHNLEVFCFALMSNHFHLLVRFNDDNASSAIKNLCERYAWFFNTKYKRKGHVFYGAFRAGLCLDDSYFLTSSLYIHANPVRAKIVSAPTLYPWSSCSLYTEQRNPETFVKYRFILELLDNDIEKAKKIYSDLLLESLKTKVGSALENSSVLRVLRKTLSHIFLKINKPIIKNNILDDTLLEKKIKELSQAKRLKKPEDIKARQYLVQQLLSRDYSLDEIAEKFNVSQRTIYDIISKASEKS